MKSPQCPLAVLRISGMRHPPFWVFFLTVQGYRVDSQPPPTNMYRFAKAALNLSGKTFLSFFLSYLILSFHLPETESCVTNELS